MSRKQTIRVCFAACFLTLSGTSCSSGPDDQGRPPDHPQNNGHPGLDGSVTLEDSGQDGTPEIRDQCPNNPEKTEPGFCGCDTLEGRCCDISEAAFVKTAGAEYKLYAQPYSEDLDIKTLTPDDSQIVTIGSKPTPTASGEHFVVVKGYLKVDAGLYDFMPGWEDSTFNVMTVAGKEVHRKRLGQGESVLTPIYLPQGYHPFEIVFFNPMDELIIWMNGGNRMSAQHLWHDEPFSKETEGKMLAAFSALQSHASGSTTLSEAALQEHAATLQANNSIFGANKAILMAAYDLVSTYEDKMGPLFIGEQTKGGFSRKSWNTDIHKVIFDVSQAIIDHAYTTENVAKCGDMFAGKWFKTADYFPGKVTSAPDAGLVHRVKISASYVKRFGKPIMHFDRPARKPTGTYLAPGTIATVTVPESLVGKGFAIRVGAHSWNLDYRPPVKRLDRVSSLYDIVHRETLVASPLGGNIYIEVPYLADEGVVEVSIRNAVRAPYFSAKAFHATTLSEWQKEREHGAPWADFQSEKFMMNVPTSWISKLEDPIALMKDWDSAMDAMNQLMGYREGHGKETMYPQVDVIMRASVHAPGYPSVNQSYDPNGNYGGLSGSHLIKGPQYAADYEFHEQGHAYGFVKYGGESESAVNLPHVAVWNQKFGYSLDKAFAGSRGYQGNDYRTLDNTAVAWMTSFNFSPRKVPMASGEKSYQLKGHAKFVDIARLFGWQALADFFYSIQMDYENDKPWNGAPNDAITLRLSEKAKVDLRPLLHFWGTPPENPEQLAADIATRKLAPSPAIYDALVHYKSLVPKDNAAFQEFALKWWGKQPSINGLWTESEHARQWDNTPHLEKWPVPERANGEIYDEQAASELRDTVQEIMDLYFPAGRP